MTAPNTKNLLKWYDFHHRKLPWRAQHGKLADPYDVWLSEIMLQQTLVTTAIPYYQSFLIKWPTIWDLAKADLDQVLHAWQGLGYYTRARNLHKCAKIVVTEFHGVFPNTEESLNQLPGIGPYTAAAIAAFAYGQKTTPVDGNIERVMSRLFAVDEPLPGAKTRLRELARSLTPKQRAGDHAQALMDLGATVCLSRTPLCDRCPLNSSCQGLRKGIAADLPHRQAKKLRSTRYGVVFCLMDNQDRILFRRRPENGLLGGMMEMPSTPWQEKQWKKNRFVYHAPVDTQWQKLPEDVTHSFTHFHLVLTVMIGSGWRAAQTNEVWQPVHALGQLALPTVMNKCLRKIL